MKLKLIHICIRCKRIGLLHLIGQYWKFICKKCKLMYKMDNKGVIVKNSLKGLSNEELEELKNFLKYNKVLFLE